MTSIANANGVFTLFPLSQGVDRSPAIAPDVSTSSTHGPPATVCAGNANEPIFPFYAREGEQVLCRSRRLFPHGYAIMLTMAVHPVRR